MKSLLLSFLDSLMSFILGFMAFLPQMMYFLYASVASLLDLLQYLLRKLAGLDVYYVNGTSQSGDIIYEFLQGILGISKDSSYSLISTVFYSFLIFGVILLVLSTIVSIIKAHYNYDANKSHPLKIVYGSLKSLTLVIIVPVVSLLGIMLSQILLKTLDEITTVSSGSTTESMFSTASTDSEGNVISVSIANQMFSSETDSNGNPVYSRYDYFSFGSFTTTSTFSGMLFDIAANSCNRVRTGEFSVQTSPNKDYWDTAGVFYVNNSSDVEGLAQKIDYAFINNLQLKEALPRLNADGKESGWLIPSLSYGYSATVGAQLLNFKSFSKFNVGAVFYYYNLWSFNFLLGFAGIAIAVTLLFNIVFGLMTRLLQVIALFLVFPALVGIMPLDGGSAFGSWRKQYVSDILMAFGAVVGMNIFFSILPFFQSISFFNQSFLDGIVNMIICLAGLTLVKKFIALTSKFIGGSDANETGQAVKDDVKNATMKGLVGTATVGKATMAIAPKSIRTGARIVGGAAKKIGSAVMNKVTGKTAEERASDRREKRIRKTLGLSKTTPITEEHEKAYDSYSRLSRMAKHEVKAIIKTKNPKTGKSLAEELNYGTPKTEAEKASAKGAHDKFNALIKNTNQKVVDKRYKRNKIANYILGGNVKDIKKGELDAEGNIKDPGSGGALRALGNAFVDFGQVAVKTVGKLTGASSVWKQLGDAGVVDDAKLSLQRAADLFNVNLSNAKPFMTKKQEEDQGERKMRADMAKQKQAMSDLQDTMNNTNAQIANLIKVLSSSRRGGPPTSPTP